MQHVRAADKADTMTLAYACNFTLTVIEYTINLRRHDCYTIPPIQLALRLHGEANGFSSEWPSMCDKQTRHTACVVLCLFHNSSAHFGTNRFLAS